MGHLIRTTRYLSTWLFTAAVLSAQFVAAAMAQEAPDALVKRVSQEVLDAAKADKNIQGGNQKHVLGLVEEKIVPHVDFQRATAMAAGRHWRTATPEQQQKLVSEFRKLLTRTYSGALAQVKDQKLEFKPFRAEPGATEVEVRSLVLKPGGDPIELDYRLEKTAAGWKIYDLNVMGAWLVETYKSSFASEIGKSGIDGLINVLTDKNNKLAAGAANG